MLKFSRGFVLIHPEEIQAFTGLFPFQEISIHGRMQDHNPKNDLIEKRCVAAIIAESEHHPHEQEIKSAAGEEEINEPLIFSPQEHQSDKNNDPETNGQGVKSFQSADECIGFESQLDSAGLNHFRDVDFLLVYNHFPHANGDGTQYRPGEEDQPDGQCQKEAEFGVSVGRFFAEDKVTDTDQDGQRTV